MSPSVQRLTIGFLFTAAVGVTACKNSPGREAHAQELAAETGSPTASCFLRAEDETTLLDAEAQSLCRGAPTPTGPLQCFLAAEERLHLLNQQAVQLCQCASSTEPVACWEQVDRAGSITDEQTEALCAPRVAFGLLPNCRPVGDQL